jgi:lysophospholipase L1-like esterase
MSVPSLILTSLASLLKFTAQPAQMVTLSNLIIASLGSSYASGPGIDPILNSAAQRSGNNYAHLLTSKLPNSTLTDLSIGGATLSTILNKTQTAGGVTFAPQIEGVPENSDVVLILGGGNDIGYNSGLIGDSNSTFNDDTLSLKYGSVLDAIHTRAPQAHVIAITYLTVLGSSVIPEPELGANVPFNASRMAYHQDVAERLRQATLKAVEGRSEWAEVLDVVQASWGHGVGSEVPWMRGDEEPARYHPLAEGHVAVAEMLYKRLQAVEGLERRRRAKL